MPMPPDTLKTLQDLEITGDGAAWAQQQQQQQQHDDNDTQHYGQQQQHQPIGSHGHQPAQPLNHLDPTAAPHPAPLPAHPPEQPHPTVPFYPPLLDHHFALDADSTIPIDPGLLGARFDHPAVPGHAGGGIPGFHHVHGHGHHGGQPHLAAAHMHPVSSDNMDNNFMVSPTTFTTQYTSSPAQLQPGMSSFEPMISTTWSMDGSLPSTSSRGLTVSSGMSVPSTSTPASSRSPGSPGKVGPGASSQPPPASRDLSYSGMQLGAWAGDQPGKKRRQTIGPRATARASTETSRSHRNNSSPGFSTPQVPIAPAPISTAAPGGDNSKSIDNRKGSSSSSSSNSKHAGKTTMTTTTTTAPTTITTTPTSNTSGPPIQAQPGPSTTTNPGFPPVPDPRARNREAANRCRAKSKVAAAELEAAERALGSEHEALTRTARSLRDEVLALKTELLMHGNCDDELIQGYLINSARVVGSGAAGTIGGAAGIANAMMTTTSAGGASGTLPGLPLQQQQQQPLPPGPSLVGGGVGSSPHAMPPVSPPRGLPTLLPSTSSGAPGTGLPPTPMSTTTTTTTTTGRTARGRGSVGGQKP